MEGSVKYFGEMVCILALARLVTFYGRTARLRHTDSGVSEVSQQ